MSVTTIIEDKQSRAFLKRHVRPPKMPDRPPPVIPSASHPGRMGTAVDYAIRFGLEVRGGYAHQLGIVADGALSVVDRHPQYAHHRDAIIDRRLEALIDLGDLHATPDLPRTVASACLRLAGLDTIFRAHRFDDLQWTPDDAAISELQAIYALTPWDALRPREIGLLNPVFGLGSSLMGGADADLIVDGCLIDIKTVSATKPAAQYIRQLVAYALLANRYGAHQQRTDAAQPVKIETLGLYFARAGHLFRFALDECIAPADHDTVIDFLIEVGERQARG